MKTIIITGTPGTGKSTLARKLSKKLNAKHISVHELIKKEKIAESYDRKKQCYVVDTKKLNKLLINKIKECKKEKTKLAIIDSHLSHYLPKKYVDLCIVTKCYLKELQKRLKRKKYSNAKIRENLDCEIFDVCLNEAKEQGHKTFVINSTKGLNIERIALILKKQ